MPGIKGVKDGEIEKLGELFERNGLEYGSNFIQSVLIPMAIREKISLRKAMNKYAEIKDVDPKHTHLRIVLFQINPSDLNKLEIDDVIEKLT